MRSALRRNPGHAGPLTRGIARALVILGVASAPCAALPSAVHAQSADSLDQLLEQARRWQARGRLDKAAEAYEKVLRSRPNDPEAIEALGLWHAREGRKERAQQLLTQLEQVAPGSVGATRLRSALTVGQGHDALLNQARAQVKAGDVDGAVASYEKAFGGAKPPQHLALEFYQTLGGTQSGWERARAGLEELVAEKPDWREAQLALARHLTYNERTRRDGIDKLRELSKDPKQRAPAIAAWRSALLWLQLDAKDAPRLKQYLDEVSDDAAVKKRLATVSRGDAASQRSNTAAAGYEALDRDNLDEASRQFSRAGDAPEASVGLALVAMRKEDFELATKLLTAVSTRAPSRPELWDKPLKSARFWSLVRRAEKSAKQSPVEAERLLREAIALSPDEAHHARVALAQVLRESGRAEQAEAELRQAIAAQPQQAAVLRALVDLQVDRHDYQAAIETNTRLAALSGELAWPQSSLEAEVLRLRAQERLARGEAVEAQRLLLEAAAMAPESYWVQHDLANLDLTLGDVASARTRVDKLLELLPGEPAGRVLQARVEAEQGHLGAALELLNALPASALTGGTAQLRDELALRVELDKVVRASTRVGPYTTRRELLRLQKQAEGKPELLGHVALAWAEAGEAPRGVELLQQLIASQRKPDPGSQLQLAVVYLHGNMHDELRHLLEELASDPDLPVRARSDLARLHIAFAVGESDRLAREGEYERAIALLEPLLAEYPEDPALTSGLGRLLLRANQNAQATATFGQVLRRDPGNVEARDGAVSAALAVGDFARAKSLVDEGLRLKPRSARMHIVSAHYQLARGDDAAAMRELTEARKLTERNPAPGSSGDAMVGTDTRGVLKSARLALATDATSAAEGKALETQIDRQIADVRARHTTEVSALPQVRYRNGEQGMGRLSEFRAPVSISFPLAYVGRLALTAEPVYVSAGKANLDQVDVAQRFGSLGSIPAVAAPRAQDDLGISPRLSVSYRDRVRAEVGTTPLGFLLTSVTGNVAVSIRWRTQSLTLTGERVAITDSLLSYAGTTDPRSGQTWGGVTAQGGVVDYAYDDRQRLFYLVGSFHYLMGKRVPDNLVGKLASGLLVTLYDWDGHSVRFGGSLLGMAFEKNQGSFTFGHGGYFSPQWFVRGGAPLKYAYAQDRLTGKLEIDPGINWFRRDAVDYYPESADLQAARVALGARARFDDARSLGFSLNLVGNLKYQVTDAFALGAQASIHFANDYEEYRGGLLATLRFDRRIRGAEGGR